MTDTNDHRCYNGTEHEWTRRSYSRTFDRNVQCCVRCGRVREAVPA